MSKRELISDKGPERTIYVVRCPECGTERETDRPPTRDRGGDFEVFFCSLRCEKNYRYRQRTRNVWTGSSKDPEDVKKW